MDRAECLLDVSKSGYNRHCIAQSLGKYGVSKHTMPHVLQRHTSSLQPRWSWLLVGRHSTSRACTGIVRAGGQNWTQAQSDIQV